MTRYFYPRPPRGGRLLCRWLFICGCIFLSTPSARRATVCETCEALDGMISIHALREEGDLPPAPPAQSSSYFYPRPPRGGRPEPAAEAEAPAGISIHALREEGDCNGGVGMSYICLFLSTPSARRATAKTERKHPTFVSLYTSLHKLQRDVCKPNRKITPLLAQTAGVPVRSVPENHVCCRFALAGHQKISTLSCANSGCSPTCSTFV